MEMDPEVRAYLARGGGAEPAPANPSSGLQRRSCKASGTGSGLPGMDGAERGAVR